MVKRHLNLKMMDLDPNVQDKKYATLKNIVCFDNEYDDDDRKRAEEAGV